MFRPALAAFVLAALSGGPASAQTVDDILSKNVLARGGIEKIRALQTLRMTGTMTVGPGMEAPFVLEQKRPNRMRLEFTVQGQSGVQAFDGNVAWQLIPFGGRREPEPIPEDQLKRVQEQADFDGPLVDYRAKGNQVELVGKEKVDGGDAWKLKVTLRNGDVRYVYLDADRYLEIRAEGRTTVRGVGVEGQAIIGDYREVSGVMVPFSVESGQKGSPQRMRMTVKEAVGNVPIDDARFRMPAK